MNEDTATAAFAALSNTTRLRIFKRLVQAAPTGLPAGEIAKAVEATPSRASFHLSAMSETGLITSDRNARQITYRVDFNAIGALLEYFMRDCCRDNAVVRSCCGPSATAASAQD